jgi:hypothetical protein
MHAAKALFHQGWTTPQKLAATSWDGRVRVLNHAGYARYDETTARMLGDTTALLLEKYKGDLRKLRHKAGGDPDEERRLLKEFKGIATSASTSSLAKSRSSGTSSFRSRTRSRWLQPGASICGTTPSPCRSSSTRRICHVCLLHLSARILPKTMMPSLRGQPGLLLVSPKSMPGMLKCC